MIIYIVSDCIFDEEIQSHRSEIVAIYDNEQAAKQHADSEGMTYYEFEMEHHYKQEN